MRPYNKPGPKSRKNKSVSQKTIRHPAADLGDSDTSNGSDEDLESDDKNIHSPAEETAGKGISYRTDVSKGQSSRRNDTALSEQRKDSVTESTSVVDKQSGARVMHSIGDSRQTTPKRNTANRPVKNKRKGVQTRNFLKNYKKLAARVDFIIPRAAFSRVVREIMMSLDTDVRYITQTAFEALQAATEAYVEARLEDANLLALHARRVTLMVRDLELINFIRSNER